MMGHSIFLKVTPTLKILILNIDIYLRAEYVIAITFKIKQLSE